MDLPLPFRFLTSGGPFLLFVLFGIGVLVFAYLNHRRQRERREQLFVLAHQRGWSFSHRDPFNLLGHGFHLFAQGDGRGVENVVYGDDGDDPVRVFDYWYYDVSTDSEGRTSKSYSHFSCALLPLHGLWAPHLRIEPEHVISRLGDALGFKDQQFESEEFNRTFQVHCDDPRFASTLVDPRMMHWLLGLGQRLRIEVLGANVLLATKRRSEAADCLALHDLAKRFRDRIPPVTSSLYPGSVGGGPGNLSG